MHTVESVMRNVYGPEATQMMGGSKKTHKGGASKYEQVAYPEYIVNSDFKKFMSEFYQIKRVVHSYASAIYVIPDTADLSKMVAEFQEELKKEKIGLNTAEAFKYASTKELPFKRCIFMMFADSEVDKYRLDASAYSEFGTVKRTNALSEQYWFKYIDDTNVMICPDEKTETGGSKVKLIAKCDNGIYVFQGKIPKAKKIFERKIAGGDAMAGGASAEEDKKKLLAKMLKKRFGAEKFVGSFAAQAKAQGRSLKKYQGVFSGDLVHSAFKIAYDKEFDEDFPEEEFGKTKIAEANSELMDQFEASEKTMDAASAVNQFATMYASVVRKSMKPKESTRNYVNALKIKYKNFGMSTLKADIGVALYRQGYKDDIQAILSLVDEIDNEGEMSEISKLEFNDEDSEAKVTSRFNFIVNNALSEMPVVGSKAKMFYPELHVTKKKTKRPSKVKTLKAKKTDSKKSEEIFEMSEEIDLEEFI